MTTSRSAILYNVLPSGASRRRLSDELLAAQQLLEVFVRHTPVSMALFDRDMRYLALSDRWRTEYGLGGRDVLGQCLYDVMPDAKAVWFDFHQRCLGGEALAAEDVFLRADGRKERMRWELQPWRGEGDGIGGLVMVTEIITERKKVEEEVRIRDAAMASAISPMAMFDLDGLVTYANQAFAEMLGYDRADDVVGTVMDRFWTRSDETALSWQTLLDTGKWIGTIDAVRRDGAHRVVQISSNLVRNPEGAPIGAMASCVDLTAQRDTERALDESQRRLSNLLDSLPGGFAFRCRHDLFWTMEIISNGCFELLGYPPEALLENRLISYSSLVHPEDEKQVRREILEAVNLARPFRVTYRIITRRGEVKWLMQQGTPQFTNAGEIQALEGVVVDVTDRVAASEDLRHERDRAEQYLDVAASIIMALDRQGRVVRFNRKGTEVTGYAEDDLVGRNWFDLIVDPQEQREVKKAFAEIVADMGDEHRYLESEVRTRSGDIRVFGWNFARIRDASGFVVSVLGSGEDLTDRREIERQLLQAQKMQAVGELTGGLAHDFNNLLMAVQGNIEFMREVADDDADIQRYISSALKAVGRGADLTQRLLAFSRKQLLRPEATSVNKLVTDMTELLKRTLGAHVEIRTSLAPGVASAMVDPAQLENALLNLAINARDAMGDGGALTIETHNEDVDGVTARQRMVDPGSYVVVAVSDTGSGMPQDVVDRAFEPFFTTKDPTKGSGLGLSMVYGFVNQSGGNIEIKSAPGEGTIVTLFLPYADVAAADQGASEAELARPTGGSETILVVEDDPEVRQVISTTLRNLGYQVDEAESASDAQTSLGAAAIPDLVLTDVMQPRGIGGIELAEWVRASYPECAILLMSGFAEDAMARNEGLEQPFPFLRKPFGRTDLANRVRSLLDPALTASGAAN